MSEFLRVINCQHERTTSIGVADGEDWIVVAEVCAVCGCIVPVGGSVGLFQSMVNVQNSEPYPSRKRKLSGR